MTAPSVEMSYFRATKGPAFHAVAKHADAWEDAKDAIAKLALSVGSTEEYLRQGPVIVGLRFAKGVKPRGWRPVGSKVMNYRAPSDAQTVARKRMLAIRLPTGEELAADLGLPGFFSTPGGSYCTSASGFLCGGLAFGAFPRALRGEAILRVRGIELIARHTYFEALDAFERYEP